MDHIHTFLTTQGHGEPPRMSDQPNAGATSETAQTWKTIHTIHTLIHSHKANMKGWLWWPNVILGLCGPKASWHLPYRWGKTPRKNPHPGNLSRPGIEPGPAAWQARMLPLFPRGGLFFNIKRKMHTYVRKYILQNRKQNQQWQLDMKVCVTKTRNIVLNYKRNFHCLSLMFLAN